MRLCKRSFTNIRLNMEALPGGSRAMAVRLFLILVLLAYSSGRYCRDRKCEQPISEAKVIKDFDDDDHKYLPVQKGEKVLVFSKADDNNYFEVEIGESRGFVPSKNLREIRMFSQESNLIQLSDVNGDDPEMDTDFVSKSKNRKRRDLVSSKAEKRSIEELHSKEHKKNPKVSDRQNLLKFVQNLEEGIQSSVHTKNSDPGVVQSAGDIKSDVDSGSTGAEDTSGGKDSMETNMDDEDVEFKGAVTAPESAAPDVDETTKHDEGSTTLEEWLKNPRFVELRERQLKDYLRSHFGEEESSPEIKNLAMELITNDLLTQLSNKGSELRRFLSEQESESEHATKEPAEGLEKTSESGVEEGHTKEIIPEQPIKSLNKGADHETTRTEGNLNPVASGNAAAVKEEERKREDSSSEESSDAGVIGSKDAVIKGMDTKDDQHLTGDDKPNDSSSLQHVPIQSEELTEADPASTDHQKKEYAASTLSDADAGQEEEKKLTEVVTDSETTSKPDHASKDRTKDDHSDAEMEKTSRDGSVSVSKMETIKESNAEILQKKESYTALKTGDLGTSVGIRSDSKETSLIGREVERSLVHSEEVAMSDDGKRDVESSVPDIKLGEGTMQKGKPGSKSLDRSQAGKVKKSHVAGTGPGLVNEHQSVVDKKRLTHGTEPGSLDVGQTSVVMKGHLAGSESESVDDGQTGIFKNSQVEGTESGSVHEGQSETIEKSQSAGTGLLTNASERVGFLNDETEKSQPSSVYANTTLNIDWNAEQGATEIPVLKDHVVDEQKPDSSMQDLELISKKSVASGVSRESQIIGDFKVSREYIQTKPLTKEYDKDSINSELKHVGKDGTEEEEGKSLSYDGQGDIGVSVTTSAIDGEGAGSSSLTSADDNLVIPFENANVDGVMATYTMNEQYTPLRNGDESSVSDDRTGKKIIDGSGIESTKTTEETLPRGHTIQDQTIMEGTPEIALSESKMTDLSSVVTKLPGKEKEKDTNDIASDNATPSFDAYAGRGNVKLDSTTGGDNTSIDSQSGIGSSLDTVMTKDKILTTTSFVNVTSPNETNTYNVTDNSIRNYRDQNFARKHTTPLYISEQIKEPESKVRNESVNVQLAETLNDVKIVSEAESRFGTDCDKHTENEAAFMDDLSAHTLGNSEVTPMRIDAINGTPGRDGDLSDVNSISDTLPDMTESAGERSGSIMTEANRQFDGKQRVYRKESTDQQELTLKETDGYVAKEESTAMNAVESNHADSLFPRHSAKVTVNDIDRGESRPMFVVDHEQSEALRKQILEITREIEASQAAMKKTSTESEELEGDKNKQPGVDDSYGSNDSNLNKDSAPTTDPNMDLDTESNKANSQSNDIVPVIQSQATGADYSGSSKVEAGVTETIHENNTDAGKRDDASYTDNESAAEQRDASQVGKEDNTPSGKMQSTITSDDKEGMNTKPTQYVSEETQAIIPSTTNDVQEKQSKGIRQEETDHVEDVSDTEQDARDTEVSENDKLLALCHEHPHLEACDTLRGAKIYRGSKDVEVPEPANDDDQPSFLSGICCSIYDWITSLVKAFLLVVKAPCNLLGLGEVLDSVIIAADKTYAVSSGAMILMLVLYPLILGPLIRCFVYYRSRYRPVKMRTDIEKSYIRRAEISEENCEKYKKELARTKEAYLEQQKERVSLEQQISELRDEMEQLNKSLIAEQKIAKSNMKDLDNALKEQQVLKSLIEEKESEIATADKVAAKHQKEIEDQKSTTTSMTARLEEFQMELTLKDNEIDNLQTMLGTAEREKSKTEEIRQKLTEDIERLEERLSETNKNIDEKEQEKEKLYEQIEGKDTELEVLRGILMTINSGQNLDGETKHDYEAPEDDPDIDEQLKTERLGKLLDSTAALAQVKKLEEDNKLLTEALGEEIEAKKSLEESYDKVKREFEETSILYKEFKTKAETNEIKLVALREHFQSQENELRRKLISEESARLESQKKFDESIVDSTTAVKEVEMLRQQVLDLKNEIKDIERSKQQLETIKTMENHNLFLQSKQAKRELEEMIRERDIYRKRLLEAETVKKSSPPETRKANSEGRASPRDSVDGGRGASPSSQQSGKLSGVPPHTASLIRSPFGPVGPPPMYGGPAPMRPPPFGPMMPGPFPPGMMPQGMVPPGMPAGMPGVLPPSLPAATAGSAMIPPAFASRDSVPSGPSSLVSGSNSSGARPPLRPKTSDLSTISGQGPSFVPLRSQPPRQGPFTSTPEQRHVPPPFGSPAGIPMVPGGPVPQNGNPPQPRPPIQGPVPPSHVGTNIHTTPFTNFQSRPTNTQPNLSSGVPKTSNPFV